MTNSHDDDRDAEILHLPTSTTLEQLGLVKPSGHSQEKEPSANPDRQMPPFSHGLGLQMSPGEQKVRVWLFMSILEVEHTNLLGIPAHWRSGQDCFFF